MLIVAGKTSVTQTKKSTLTRSPINNPHVLCISNSVIGNVFRDDLLQGSLYTLAVEIYRILCQCF